MKTNTTKLLNQLKNEYRGTLQSNLVGIYLHGSYVLGCYNEAVSDLDYVVVVKKGLTYEEEKRILSKYAGGKWGMCTLPKQHSILIEKAIKQYTNSLKEEVYYSMNDLHAFASEMLLRIESE